MTQRFYMVDVFAERRYAGNQLAVVVGDEPLAEQTMQAIAAETNFSETTFVSAAPEADGGYRVRIYTPARELAFAGHPILGTAWVLRRYVASSSDQPLRLNLAVGQVPVRFETDTDGTEIGWFLAPPMTLGVTVAPETVAAAFGLAPTDIDARAPVRVVSAGTAAIIAPLRNLDALRRAKPDPAAYAAIASGGLPPLVYLFCRETHERGNDLCARFFFEAHGVREDPATGNGAAFLGAYLLEHRLLDRSELDLRIEQGHEIQRPSLVMLRAQFVNGSPEVSVGGGVIPTVEGRLL